MKINIELPDNYNPQIDITKDNINDIFSVEFCYNNTSINLTSVTLVYRRYGKLYAIDTGIDGDNYKWNLEQLFPLKQIYHKINVCPDNTISIITSNDKDFRVYVERDTELTLDYLNKKYREYSQ